ncbi:MAG: hypothetical protein ACI8XO_001884 [Verrucomicrobiales bacterium]|jgi:hypothetical protein
MKTNSKLLLCAALIALTSLQSLPARELFKLVRLEDDAAAGTTGTFNSFSSAIINNSDELGFRGNLNPGSGVNSGNNLGVWQDDANLTSGVNLVAREASAAPGAPGATFTDLINSSTFQINDDGDMVFRAKLQGGSVSSVNDFGIWYRPGGSSILSLVAREGDAAPGTDGVFSFVDIPTQSDVASGEVYFKTIITGGTTTIFNNNALYGYIGGTLTLIHREGDVTPVLPIGASGPLSTSTYGDFTADPMVSADGKLIFSANIYNVPSRRNEVLFIRDSGTTTALLQEDTPLPNAGGAPTSALISKFTAYSVNNSSEIIVRVGLRFNIGGVTSANNEAIVTNAGGVFRQLAREGSITPEGGSTFRRFANIYIGNSGATGLFSLVTPVDDAIYSAAATSAFVAIAKEGTAAAGTDSTYNALSRPAMNHAGQFLFTSTLDNGGATNNANNSGLWRTTGSMTPPTPDELIAREGDFEDDICGNIISFELNSPNLSAAGVAGAGRAINDNDNLVIGILTTTSGFGSVEGIYVLGDNPPVFCDPPQDELRNIVAGSGSVAVFWTEPTVIDDDTVTPPTVVSTHSSGASFSPGVTIITYTATDSGGNISEIRFRVIVTEIRDLNKVLIPNFVARDGDAAPDSEIFRIFSGICINDDGAVTFEASTVTKKRGIWSNGSGPLLNRAITADVLVGTAAMNTFSDFRIMPSGESAFTTKVNGGGVTAANDVALLAEFDASSNSLVAYEGDAAADGMGATIRQFFEPAVSQSASTNYVIYPARLVTGGASTATTSNDTGIWFFDADAAAGSDLMVRESQSVDAIPSLTYGNISQRAVTGGSNQAYVFTSRLLGPGVISTNNQAVFADVVSTNSPELLLRKGDIASGPEPSSDANSQWKKATSTLDKITRRDTGRYRTFLGESTSPNGENIAIHASLVIGGAVNSANDTGIWLIDTARVNNFIARESHQAPGFPEGVCFSRFEDIVATDDGEVWFRAYLAHDSALGINSSNDCGIWSSSEGFLRWFAHEGQLAPNTDAAVVRAINTFSYDEDGFAATLRLVPGSGDALNKNSRLLATGLDSLTGLFQTNIRQGDQFEESPTVFRTISLLNIIDPFNAAGGSGGYSNAVSGVAEQVVLKVSFSGNGNGVILRDLSNVGP